MRPADRAHVVLVHGLWMNGFAMLPLAWRLEHCGFAVTRHGYRSVSRGLQENARALAVVCNRQTARLHLVGHSLGGLVILAMLAEHTEIPVHRVVLLGSPYADSAAVHGMERFGWSRRAIGRSVRDWLDQPRPAIPDGVELGVIAGDLPVGLGRVFVRMPAASDGVVLVEETHVPGARDSVLLHTSHSAMLISPAVAAQVCAFLATGRFAR